MRRVSTSSHYQALTPQTKLSQPAFSTVETAREEQGPVGEQGRINITDGDTREGKVCVVCWLGGGILKPVSLAIMLGSGHTIKIVLGLSESGV